MTHLQPDRLRDAMTVAGLDVAGLTVRSGVRSDFIEDALGGRRRLGVAVMKALAEPLGVEWWALRCDHAFGKPECPGCGAPSVLAAADLADAAEAIRNLLSEARERQVEDVGRLAEMPSFAAAHSALIAVGGDFDLDRLAAVGAHELLVRPAVEADISMRLAIYCARGDVETDEVIGLDIDGEIPNGLHIAGWDLVRFSDEDLDDYEVIPAGSPQKYWSWDRTAVARTWWLRRPAGVQEPRTGPVLSVARPANAVAAPHLTLALLKNEPPSVLSHGWAQRGLGVSLSAASRQLDYIIGDDGYPNMQYGPYYVETKESTRWARCAVYLGGLAERVWASETETAEHYVAAAEQFLGVSKDLYKGWDPLPRLALEMSTVAEMLLGTGGKEEISRSIRIAAAWLGGINDADRDVIVNLTKKIYEAGSAYRHGGTRHTLHRGTPVPRGRKPLDVLRAYRLLRRLMMHGLAVVAAGKSPADLCDRAQLTEAARTQLAEIVSNLYSDLQVAPRPFPAA